MAEFPDYRQEYATSLRDPDGFWGAQAQLIDWDAFPTTTLDASRPHFPRWFPDGRLNTCFNAVDRHVRDGRGDQVALIHDSPITSSITQLTYAQLQDHVARFAGVLASLGVVAGDRVLLYLPMVPEAVVAMLACARLGAVHCVVFGGFAAPELAGRIDDARPRVVVAASCGLEPTRIVRYDAIVREALELAGHEPDHVVVLQREQAPTDGIGAHDVDWHDAMSRAQPTGCVSVAADDPLYILYTSGTTGRPKGVVRDNGGHAVALRWSMEHVYGITPADTWWAASDVGWVVGHSYIVYAPLLCGATTVLYEGKPVGTPDAGAFWRVASQHRVAALFTAPTAIRAIKRDDPQARLAADYDLSALRTLFLAGERLDPDTYEWATGHLGIPVVDNWWQTETGWPICANPRGLSGVMPPKAGSPSVPMPGYDVRVLSPDGIEVPREQEGAIAVRLPLPPGTLLTLWQSDERYERDYLATFDGYYTTGDGGYVDEDGFVFVMGRTDDVINVSGHRLSTGALEAVLAAHPAVAECAVIGVHDELKGQVPRGLVVLKSGVDVVPEDLVAELIANVRNTVGPVADLKQIDVVAALPKTRSGKILRTSMRSIADGHDVAVPATIEDPEVLEQLRPLLAPPS